MPSKQKKNPERRAKQQQFAGINAAQSGQALAFANSIAGAHQQATVAYSGTCDVTKVKLTPGPNWYHKPGFGDLCKAAFDLLPPVERLQYTVVLSGSDLKAEHSSYVTPGVAPQVPAASALGLANNSLKRPQAGAPTAWQNQSQKKKHKAGSWQTGKKASGAGAQAFANNIRKCLDAGNLQQAYDLFHASPPLTSSSVVESTVMPLLRALAAASRCDGAAAVAARFVECEGTLNSRQALQIMNAIGMQSTREDGLELIQHVNSALTPQAFDQHGFSGLGYFRYFSQLLGQEHLAEAQEGLQNMRQQSQDSLVRQGACIANLKLVSQQSLNLKFQGHAVSACLGIQKGDAVLASAAGQESTAIEGVIVDIFPTGLSLKATTSAKAAPGASWRIDKVCNRTVHERELWALRSVCVDPDWAAASGAGGSTRSDRVIGRQLRQVILAEVSSTVGQGAGMDQKPEAAMCAASPEQAAIQFAGRARVNDAFFRRLNDSQRSAIGAAVGRQVTLVQGPPGTGKTHTAVGLCAEWARRGFRPILAVADSNQGVDNLYMGLKSAGIECVRLGSKSEQDKTPATFELFTGGVSAKGGGKGAAQSQDRDAFFAQQKRMMKSADVICTTCAGAGNESMFEKMAFPAVLVDEASQSTEPSVLIPFAKGARMCALVGDHEQLPATVLCPQAQKNGLARSLFDRLVLRGVEPHLLDTQYRMHPAIAAFPSIATYGGRIRSGVPKQLRKPPGGFQWPMEGVPIAFVPVDGSEQKAGTSFSNQREATMVAQILKQLLAHGDLRATDIGVVTPYQEQVRLLSRMLPKEVEVSSVDGYQGREKELICVSTVRANAQGNLGFLRDGRRTNVTITRAKRGLLVFGHAATLEHDDEGLWGRWLAWVKDRGLVHGIRGGSPELASALANLDADGSETGKNALLQERTSSLGLAVGASRSSTSLSTFAQGSAGPSTNNSEQFLAGGDSNISQDVLAWASAQLAGPAMGGAQPSSANAFASFASMDTAGTPGFSPGLSTPQSHQVKSKPLRVSDWPELSGGQSPGAPPHRASAMAPSTLDPARALAELRSMLGNQM